MESSVLAGIENFVEKMALAVMERIVEGWGLAGIEWLVGSRELTETQKVAKKMALVGTVGLVEGSLTVIVQFLGSRALVGVEKHWGKWMLVAIGRLEDN